jgi:GDPmannose 4,6-dehydratase
MKALIFGINGQDGYYLSHLLKENQIEVVGISRTGHFIRGSVADYSFVEKQIKLHNPTYVFHLAANSTTQHYALFENHETISTGTLNILEAVYKFSPKTKVFLSGSAMQFENKGLPIDENTPWSASSPYSVARIQSVYAGRYYRELGIEVYVGYFFNHDSPLRSEKHVNQKIVKAVQRIKQGTLEKIELGNIEVKKEFNYAGDIVEAVWKLVNQDTIFEVVIGCGKAYSIKDWLECFFEMINKNWQNFVDIKQNFVPEYHILVSNPKLIKSLGWEPKVNFLQLAKMMMGDI